MAHRIPKSSAKFKDIQKYSKMFNRENFAQLMVNQFLTRVFLIPVALKRTFFHTIQSERLSGGFRDTFQRKMRRPVFSAYAWSMKTLPVQTLHAYAPLRPGSAIPLDLWRVLRFILAHAR
jgi:hypothetical protein